MSADTIPQPAFDTLSPSRKRYVGDDMGMSMASFSPDISQTVRKLYEVHQELLEVCDDVRLSGEIAALMRATDALGWKELVAESKSTLVVSEDDSDADHKRKILHDVRGGAFSNVSMLLDMMAMLGAKASLWHVERLYFLIRDHLKIMRNCFSDLDTPKRNEDLSYHYHSTSLLREKWDGYKTGGNTVTYHSDEEVDIASCCMEFSTLDRVLYNLVNNALRHTDDAVVELHALGRVDTQNAKHMCFYTCNEVTDSQRKTLTDKFGENLSRILEGGFTTTGSGLGLRICSECVTSAYQLGSARIAVDRNFVGAMLLGNKFYAWIHWPQIAD